MSLTREEKFEAIINMLDRDGYKVYSMLQAYDFRPIWQGINDGSPISITLIENPTTGEWERFEIRCTDDRFHNEQVINQIFDDLAYEVYLRKKEEFKVQPRNKRGQFQSYGK